MKNILLAFMMITVISCTDENGSTTKPISGQVPSDNKLVLAGTPIGNSVSNIQASSNLAEGTEIPKATEFSLLDRLYDTVWFQSEEDIDDGILEVETEFLFFKKVGDTVRLDEVEMENGIIDTDDENEYSILTDLDTTTADPTKLNAFVARNIEFENGRPDNDDEAEYEGYYLRDNRTLYVIDDGTVQQVNAKLQAMIAIPNDTQLELLYNDDRYILSEKPTIGSIIRPVEATSNK